MKWHWAALFLLLLAANSPGQEAPPRTEGGTQAWVYPFVEKGRWGYISQDGAWLVPPRYDEVGAETQGELLPVREGRKWGLVDRSGAMVLKPQFDFINAIGDALFGYPGGGVDQKSTLLVLSDNKIKQIACDWIGNFSEGAAWARRGKYLGLLSETGEWKIAPKMLWGADNPVPEPLNHGVSWFERDKMLWGLIGKDGRVLLKPVVSSWVHYFKHSDGVEDYGRISQSWHDGKTWVQEGDRWKLITLEGKELASVKAQGLDRWDNTVEAIQRWGDLPCFAAPLWKWSQNSERVLCHLAIIGLDGRICLDADIDPIPVADFPSPEQLLSPEERSDLTKVPWDKLAGRMQETFTAADGSQYHRRTWFENGCALYERWALIDRTYVKSVFGLDFDRHELFKMPDNVKEVNTNVWNGGNWSEGLAPVLVEPNTVNHDLFAGFVDTAGKMVIPPLYGRNPSSFYKGIAWVGAPPSRTDASRCGLGLIDRSGKQILPFGYAAPKPAERPSWYPLAPSREQRNAYLHYRDFIVVVQNERKGLVTREGKVILPPEYGHFGDLIDGRAVVGKYDKDLHQNRYGVIDREGKLVVPAKYMGLTSFCKGVAWARDTEGLQLIDTEGKVLSNGEYACLLSHALSWKWENPFARDALCCVCQSEDTHEHIAHGWGWVDEKGRVVRWSDEARPQRYHNMPIPGDRDYYPF